MPNYTMFNTLLVLICITLFLHIFDVCKSYAQHFLSYFADRFRSKASVEEPTDAYDEAELTSLYDVESYNNRIQELMQQVDEDGLYDIPDIEDIEELAGVEVITDNYEMQLDRRL